jgi:chloride channel 7
MAFKSALGLAAVNHQYTDEERQILNSYQSLEYLPPHSKVYRNWLQQQPARLDWDRWLMMGLIGFSVGILGFLLHQIIDLISEVKWEQTQEYIQVRSSTKFNYQISIRVFYFLRIL